MGASLPLKISLGLVMLAAAIELALISATVAYLAQLKTTTFSVRAAPPPSTSTHAVPGLPDGTQVLLVNQGHTANGAAGTGLVLVGCGGILALWLRGRAGYYYGGGGGTTTRVAVVVYRGWLVLSVAALLLTAGALGYVAAVTRMHAGSALGPEQGGSAPPGLPVVWTPQGWLEALLGLEFVEAADRAAVRVHARVARGWEYNLVPMFLVQLAQTVFALVDAWRRRRAERGVYVDANSDKEGGFGAWK